MAPVVTISAQVCKKEGKDRKNECYRDIAGHVTRAGHQTDEVSKKDKEKEREQVRQIALVFCPDIRTCNLVTDKEYHRLNKRLQPLRRTHRIAHVGLSDGSKHEQQQRGIDKQHPHILGNGEIQHLSICRLKVDVAMIEAIPIIRNQIVVLIEESRRGEDIEAPFF